MKGKQLNDRGLAFRLREYGVKSKTLSRDGESRSKGYVRADLGDVWERYLPSSERSVPSVPSVPSPNLQGSKGTDGTARERFGTDGGSGKSADRPTDGTDGTDGTIAAGDGGGLSGYDAVLAELAARGDT